MNDKITFTTTSLCRPKISKKSLDSLSSSIDVDLKLFRIYLNIDPFPLNGDPNSVESLFKNYFGEVISNKPSSPNFANAIKWCWSTADSDFIFHYEDDWLFKRFSLKDVLNKMQKNTHQVRLRAYEWDHYTHKLSLSPSLIKKDCYKAFGKGMCSEINPEVQLRNKSIFKVSPTGAIIYSKDILCSDIGRNWLTQNNFKKNKIKNRFIKY